MSGHGFPQIGDTEGSHLSVYALLQSPIPPPPQSLVHHTGPPSLFIKNVITPLFARVKTNTTRFGGRTGGCSLYLCQETQRVSINVMHLFPVQSHFPPENVIIKKL